MITFVAAEKISECKRKARPAKPLEQGKTLIKTKFMIQFSNIDRAMNIRGSLIFIIKKLILFVLIFCQISCQAKNNNHCVIQMDINGLQVGDFIVLSTIQKPIYKILSSDTLYVEEPNKFSFNKELVHTVCLNIRFQSQKTDTDNFSIGTFLVKPGDSLLLHGTVTDRSTIKISGGFYNDPLVARLEHLERTKDVSLSDELKELRTYIMKEVNDNEYAVYLFLDNMVYVTYDELRTRFEGLEPHIKNSHMGQNLKNTINIWALLQPEEQAPKFTVRDISENVLNLSDYKGKYLLIYCWDFCPTTFQVQIRLTDLYQRFGKDQFAILAFTPDDPQKLVSKISIVGIDDTDPIIVNYRQQLLDQLAQPWSLAYTNHPENNFMVQKYYICNSTMLTFISPEGKIIARSYFTDLEEVLQTIERKLQQASKP